MLVYAVYLVQHQYHGQGQGQLPEELAQSPTDNTSPQQQHQQQQQARLSPSDETSVKHGEKPLQSVELLFP